MTQDIAVPRTDSVNENVAATSESEGENSAKVERAVTDRHPFEEIERRAKEDGLSDHDRMELHRLCRDLFRLEDERNRLIRQFVVSSLDLTHRPTRLKFLSYVLR